MRKRALYSSYVLLAVFSTCCLFAQVPNDTLITSGKASFYADQFHGQETSSGDMYNQNDFTAAHRTLPFGTIVSVTNKKNGKNVIVRINDRGPFVKSRIIDLTKSAAKKIGMVPFGVVPVKIQVLDLLDCLPMNDSLVSADEMIDCYGNKSQMSLETVYVWSTEDIKHAFYMATSFVIDYDVDSVIVQATNEKSNRRYKIFVTHIETKKEAARLVAVFREDGFRFSKIFSPMASAKALPPVGQPAK
jgi:rare lipoprotein A